MNVIELLIFLVLFGLVVYVYNLFLAPYIDKRFQILINIVLGVVVVVYVLHLCGVAVPYLKVK